MDVAPALPLYHRSCFQAAPDQSEFFHKDYQFICLVQLKNGRWLSLTPNSAGISESFEHAAYRALRAHNLLPQGTPEPPGAPIIETV